MIRKYLYGGPGYFSPSRLPNKNDKYDSLNKSESIRSKVSTAIMNYLWMRNLRVAPSATDLTRDGGVALRTYLLDREEQKKEFLKAGYIEGKKGDYGLVRRAVGNRNIPIYQREPDAAKREDLVPIGNINNRYYPEKGELIHAGNFPTALYYNYQNSKFYLKAWDLNDYGGSSGHTPLLKFGANVLDKIGSPTVVTSGFLEISNDTLRDYHETLSPFIKKFFKSKGLIYDYLESTDVNPTIHLPEITITGKSRNKLSNSNSDLIYIEGRGLINKAKRTFQKGGRIDRENYIPNLFNEGGYIKENNNYINGYVRDQNNHPISFDTEGNLVDLVSGEKGTMILPGFNIIGISPKTRAKNYSSAYHPEDALEFFDIMTRPITAPITPSLQVGAIRNALNGGNYYKSLMGIEPNLGITTENFNKEHPYLSMGANLAIDLAIPFGFRLFNKGYPYKTSRGTLAIKASSKSSYNTSGGIKITPESEIEWKYPIYRDMKKSKHFKPFSEPYFEELIDNKNVTLLGLLDAGKYSEYLAERIIQNMKHQGFDPDVPSSKIIHNGLRLYGTPSRMIREKSTEPINIYITDEPTNVIGFLLRDNGKAYARVYPNATPEKIRLTTIHEGISHGTDDVVNTATDGAAADLYGRITKAVKDAGFAKTKGTEQWYELRSTMAEFMAKMFRKYVRAFPGSTYADILDAVYKEINNMSVNKLADELKSLNNYGRDYGEYLMLNPFEANKFKELLKYGMGLSAPIGITNYGFKNNN